MLTLPKTQCENASQKNIDIGNLTKDDANRINCIGSTKSVLLDKETWPNEVDSEQNEEIKDDADNDEEENEMTVKEFEDKNLKEEDIEVILENLGYNEINDNNTNEIPKLVQRSYILKNEIRMRKLNKRNEVSFKITKTTFVVLPPK